MTSIKLDLHIHTIFSGDSLIKPLDAIKYAKQQGLDGLAITDHHSLKAYRNMKTVAREYNLIIIPGVEIKTHIGEVIALFINENMRFKENEKFINVVEKIKESNGLIVIPHPFDFLRDSTLQLKNINDNIIKKFIDGIEIINSRIILKRCVKKARDFNKIYNLFESGGSDAHSIKEIGNGYTLIQDTDKSLESIRKSLLSNKSRSLGKLSSPFVHAKTVFNKLKKGLYF